MNNTLLVLVFCFALAACAKNAAPAADTIALHETQPAESVLTVSDMNECGVSLGMAPVKSSSDIYALSAESLEKIRSCALGREKQRMPLLADLIDQYAAMLRKGSQECARDIGTHYGDVCMRNSQREAAAWYNRAVSQRLASEMPHQPQKPARD